jgi:S-adenosylmethionine:diacylglycerol 3-amino-3-carboxypropyl transferase
VTSTCNKKGDVACKTKEQLEELLKHVQMNFFTLQNFQKRLTYNELPELNENTKIEKVINVITGYIYHISNKARINTFAEPEVDVHIVI